MRLTKPFDDVAAVRGIDLDIARRRVLLAAGAVGCGKTTTLRMIAGFERPTSGEILLDGKDLVAVPAHRRPVNTVFQSYALFPFLDVWDNVAFGLRYQKVDKAETRAAGRRDARAGPRWRRTPTAGPASSPAASSSGWRSPARWCCSRGCCCSTSRSGPWTPSCASSCSCELKPSSSEVGITFVYVTHDQEEALTMSDRLAVMADGLIEQVGTPEAVYSAPATAYVAGFLGSANVARRRGRSAGRHRAMACRLGPFAFKATGDAKPGPARW